MIYLATPYTSPDPDTRNWRFHRARSALFTLWDHKEPAICPIVLGHEYERRQRTGHKDLPHEFWMMMARSQLAGCTRLYLLTLPGWRESIGVRMEVELAHGMGRPVICFAPIADCEEVSGIEILAEFGLQLTRRERVQLPQRSDDE